MTDPQPTRTLAPALAGPSLFPTLVIRQLVMIGYGTNAIVTGSPAMTLLAGSLFSFWWAVVFTAVAVLALAGVWLSEKQEHVGLETLMMVLQTGLLIGLAAGNFWNALHGRGVGFTAIWFPLGFAAMSRWRGSNAARSKVIKP